MDFFFLFVTVNLTCLNILLNCMNLALYIKKRSHVKRYCDLFPLHLYHGFFNFGGSLRKKPQANFRMLAVKIKLSVRLT